MDESFAVPCPPFSLQLSSWDKLNPPSYSRRVMCFPLPNNTNKHNEHIVHLLLTALQSTVEELPFLAGSVVHFFKDQLWQYDVRPHGAAYLDVKNLSQKINFFDLRKARFSPSLLDSEQLCPLTEFFYVQDGPFDVCHLQANFVDGGLILVVSIIHKVCDGGGISEVMKIFADKFRKAQTVELTSRATDHEESQKHAYSCDRNTILSGNRLPGATENRQVGLKSRSLSLDRQPSEKTFSTAFHISSNSLRALKLVASPLPLSSSVSAAINGTHQPDGQQIHSSDQGTSISTHDAIVGLIWRSIMLARYRAGILSDRTMTSLSQSIDCRTRCRLPKLYFGNAVCLVTASLVLLHLALGTDSVNATWISWLQAAARAILAEVNGFTADKFYDMLGFLESNPQDPVGLSMFFEVGNIILSSWFNSEMYELDFGEALGGKMEAFRIPSQGILPCVSVVLPRLPDGSCEFVVNETEEVTKFFAEDEILRKFATECC